MHKLSPTFIIRRAAEESRDSLKSSSPSLTGSHRNLKDKRHEKFDEHFLDQPQRRRLVSFAGLHANSFRWGWKPADYLKFASDAFHLQWRWTRHLRRGSWARTCVSRSRQTLSRRLWLIRNFMSFSRIQSNLSGGLDFFDASTDVEKIFTDFLPFTGKLVPFVELTVAHASILTILAISFERYYAICEPLKAGYVCTKTRAMVICVVCWFIAGLFTRWAKGRSTSLRSCIAVKRSFH